MSEPIKIAITISDGMLHSVLSAGVPVHYVAIDHDTDNADDDDLFPLSDGSGGVDMVVGHFGDAEIDGAQVLEIFDAKARHEAGDDAQTGTTKDYGHNDTPQGKAAPLSSAIELEFWIGTVTDEDGDLHNSETIWRDGATAAEVLADYRNMVKGSDVMLDGKVPADCTWAVHGPYSTNEAAKG